MSNRGGKRRGVRINQRSFERQLLKAEGVRYKFTRNIQSQFKVPFISALGSTEPTAQYMWVRQPLATEDLSDMYHPMVVHDISAMISSILGTGWWSTTINSEIWETVLQVAWQARYSVTNLSNTPVDYERLVFRVKRDVPNFAAGTVTLAMGNPFNIVGEYLYQTGDKAAGDSQSAVNAGLHTERIKLENIPAWYHWYKLVNKKRFTLHPGATKKHVLRRKPYLFHPIDQYPTIVAGQIIGQPSPSYCRMRGDTFIVYKMISRPADINDAVAPLEANSTRTAPLSLMAYQCNYLITKPSVRKNTVLNQLVSYGLGIAAADANIAVMADEDFKEEPQINVN